MESFKHICEVCEKEEYLNSSDAFNSGWDYPPNFGDFGVISPRTCGDCGIEKTLWWAITTRAVNISELPQNYQRTLDRILAEKPI